MEHATAVSPGQVREVLCGSGQGRCICWVASTQDADAVVQLGRLLSSPADCHVVLCLDSPRRLGERDEAGALRSGPLTPALIREAAEMLRQLYGTGIRAMVLPGHPVTEIRRYVRTHNIDLVVMGEQALAMEHEYGERLLDDPPCSVLVFVGPHAGGAERSVQ